MSVRSITAAAALAAAVAVCVAVRRGRVLRRRLACQAVEHRLMEGCLHRDLDAFRTRIDLAMAQRAVVAEAGLVLDEALAAHHRIDPYMEGGSS